MTHTAAKPPARRTHGPARRFAVACALFAALFVTLTAAVTFAPAAAQEPVPALVQVDLLIFRHDTTPPEQVKDIVLTPARRGAGAYAGAEAFSTPTGIVAGGNLVARLPEATSALLERAEKIRESENFELLDHPSWRQEVRDPQTALYFSFDPLRRGGLLKGAAKLSFERYFQLAVTLLYEPDLALEAEPAEQDSAESDAVIIHFKEVMTDNQLYYLDHPLLGVLAQITVIETEPSAENGEEDDDG